MEFFISFFGIMFFLLKSASEAGERIDADRRLDAYQAEKERLSKFVASSKTLRELDMRVTWAGNLEAVIGKLGEDLEYIYGPNYRNVVDFYSERFKLRDLWLAKDGLSTDSIFWSGHTIGGKDTAERDIRLYQRVEYHLNKHGANIRFVMKPKISYDNRGWKPKQHIDYTPYYATLVVESLALGDNCIRLW